MSSQPHEHVVIDVGPIELNEADGAYVVGAFLERREAQAADGRPYHLTDFIREALIEASHRSGT